MTAISSRSNVKNLTYEESDEVLASGLENPAIGPLASDWPGLAPALRNWLSPKLFRPRSLFLSDRAARPPSMTRSGLCRVSSVFPTPFLALVIASCTLVQ